MFPTLWLKFKKHMIGSEQMDHVPRGFLQMMHERLGAEHPFFAEYLIKSQPPVSIRKNCGKSSISGDNQKPVTLY